MSAAAVAVARKPEHATRREPAHPRAPSAAPAQAAPGIQRTSSCACGGGCPGCQATAASPGAEPETGVPASVNETLRSAGRPLDPPARAFMETRFGHDFGAVRLHTDAGAAQSARDIGALAYTRGADIVFGPGQFAPDTPRGQRLLAHELAHVVQQRGGGATLAPRRVAPADSAQEREADTAADAVMAGRAPTLQQGGGPERLIQRQCEELLPPCPNGWESRPSSSGIGSAFGQWLGLQYRQSNPVSTYLLIDWWLYSAGGKVGTIGNLVTIDPFVLNALQANPDWTRRNTQRIDILASDTDEVFEIKPIRGAGAGPAQLAGYLTSLRTVAPVAPAWMGSRPRNWRPGLWVPPDPLFVVPVSMTELCYICTWPDPANAGVLLYDILCCDLKAPPPPVWLPKELFDKLLEKAKDFLNRLGQAIDDLGVTGKVVLGALAAIAIAALVIALLPAEIAAAIGAFFAAIGAAIGAAIAALLAELGLAFAGAGAIITTLLLEGAANADPGPSTQAPAKGAPSKTPSTAPSKGTPSGAPRGGSTGAGSPAGPDGSPGLVERAIEILKAIERAPSKDPRAAELKKLAAKLLPLLEGSKAPAARTKKKTQAPAKPPGAGRGTAGGGDAPAGQRPVPSHVPGFDTEHTIPPDAHKVHAEHCVVEGITARMQPGDQVHDALIVVHMPWFSFAAVVKLKVISNDGKTMVLEFAEDWWVKGLGGGYKGGRIRESVANLGKCGTVHWVATH